VLCEVGGRKLFVRLGEREGSFVPERRSVHLELRGVGTRPNRVSANGEEADWRYEPSEKRLVVRLAEDAGETVVEANLSTAF